DAENPSDLAIALEGKQGFLLPAQENWDTLSMASFGASVGQVLRQFVTDGGLLICCDFSPEGGTSQFLSQAGLMNVVYDTSGNSFEVQWAAAHPFLEGVNASFTAMDGAVRYSSVGDGKVLVKETATGKPIVAVKTIGSGRVLLLGW